LASLLLPALRNARAEGQTAHCLGTLHNLGVAATLYLEENDGYFWPYYVDVPDPGRGRQWWFGFEPDGPPSNPNQTHRPLDKTRSRLAPYLTGTTQDFRCPAFPYDTGRYFPKFSPPAGGYGYNTAAMGGFNQLVPGGGTSRSVREFGGRTADVFVFADGLHFDRLDYSSNPPLEQGFNEPAYIQWQDPTRYGSNVGINGGYGHFRHNGRAAVLYLDAHAAAQPARRPLHPYSSKGLGPVANLSDDAMRVRAIRRGSVTLYVDLIYGLE